MNGLTASQAGAELARAINCVAGMPDVYTSLVSIGTPIDTDPQTTGRLVISLSSREGRTLPSHEARAASELIMSTMMATPDSSTPEKTPNMHSAVLVAADGQRRTQLVVWAPDKSQRVYDQYHEPSFRDRGARLGADTLLGILNDCGDMQVADVGIRPEGSQAHATVAFTNATKAQYDMVNQKFSDAPGMPFVMRIGDYRTGTTMGAVSLNARALVSFATPQI